MFYFVVPASLPCRTCDTIAVHGLCTRPSFDTSSVPSSRAKPVDITALATQSGRGGYSRDDDGRRTSRSESSARTGKDQHRSEAAKQSSSKLPQATPEKSARQVEEEDVAEDAEETIQLGKFLKIQGLVESGGEAKNMIQNSEVLVNGQVEVRRGKRLRQGDKVTCNGVTVDVIFDDVPE